MQRELSVLASVLLVVVRSGQTVQSAREARPPWDKYVSGGHGMQAEAPRASW